MNDNYVFSIIVLSVIIFGVLPTWLYARMSMRGTFTVYTMKCRRCGETLKSRFKIWLDIRCVIHKINCKVI